MSDRPFSDRARFAFATPGYVAAQPDETGADLRRWARAGFDGQTVGRAPGFIQANLYAVPESHAAEFEAFCHANPAACPLIGRSEPGGYAMPALGADIDLRTDMPRYVLHRGGHPLTLTEVRSVWREDLVTFVIGCWLGAEASLQQAGVAMRHRALGRQGGLYRTALPAVPAGRLNGPLVVSMRPFLDADVEAVTRITAALPRCHGAPIHRGEPEAFGIADLSCPDWGEAVLPLPGETALYWPCGLTALAALNAAAVPFFISHAPGAMLVTDLKEALAS